MNASIGLPRPAAFSGRGTWSLTGAVYDQWAS